MEEDRRVPSNSDILTAINLLTKPISEIVGIQKDIQNIKENVEKQANNNVNQWKAIRLVQSSLAIIDTRCEERIKNENTRLSKGFTLKSILVAAIAGGFISLLCNYIPVLIK